MHIFDFFRDIFSVFGAFSRFLGVKSGFRKSCLCKRNDKYEVWAHSVSVPISSMILYSDPTKRAAEEKWADTSSVPFHLPSLSRELLPSRPVLIFLTQT